MNHNGKMTKYFLFRGAISQIRDIEDCIRQTKKYSEGIRTQFRTSQGGEFSSRKFRKYYEVYPDMEVSWDMGSGDAIDLLWGDSPRVDVEFDYDYREGMNRASVTVYGNVNTLESLYSGIPALCGLLLPEMSANGYRPIVDAAIAHTQRRIKEQKEAQPSSGKSSLWDKVVDTLTPRKGR